MTPSLRTGTTRAGLFNKMPIKPSTTALSLPYLLSLFPHAPSTTLPLSSLTCPCLPQSSTQCSTPTSDLSFFFHKMAKRTLSSIPGAVLLLPESFIYSTSTSQAQGSSLLAKPFFKFFITAIFSPPITPLSQQTSKKNRFDLQLAKVMLLK